MNQNYDPVTGEPITNPVNSQPSNSQNNYDPMTGQPITNAQPVYIPVNANANPNQNQPSVQNIWADKNKRLSLILGCGLAAFVALMATSAVVMHTKGSSGSDADSPIALASADDQIDQTDDNTTDNDSNSDNTPSSGSNISSPVIPTATASEYLAFGFDGKEYSLPVKVETLLNDGWTFNDENDADEVLGSSKHSYYYMYVSGKQGQKIDVYVTNFSKDSKKASECYVTEINFYTNDLIKLGKDATLHNGDISVSRASLDDVLTLYGKPDNTYDSASFHLITYYLDHDDDNYNRCIKFTYDDEEYITHAGIRNETQPEDMEPTVVSNDPPEYLSEYVSPEELGSDLLSANFKAYDNVYNLPVPLMNLLNDGWTYDEKYADTVIGSDQTYSVTLKKDDYRLYVEVTNFSDKGAYLNNTMVTSVGVYSSARDRIVLELPCGLTIESSDSDIKSILADNEITNYNYQKDHKYYKIPLDQTDKTGYPKDYIRVYIDNNGKVESLYIVNFGPYRKTE